jgi:ArsR family transcriptional regulator, virulence genes transcriptional regulator
MHPTPTIEFLEQKAAEVSATLRLLANEKRLLVLCRLAQAGEMSVTELGAAVGLSQSALSQHLAKLRADGLVTSRRQSQTVYYRIADGRVAALLDALHEIYCVPEDQEPIR